MPYVVHILILIAIFGALALSLDLLVGHTGMLSLAQAAFFGIGAYAMAVLALRFGIPVWAGALAGTIIAAAIAGIVGFVTAGLRDDYFVIATFSLQLVFSNLCENLLSVTRGPLGIPGIPALEIAGSALPQSAVLGVALVFLTVVGCAAARLAASPFGRVLHAIREDDVLTRSWGKDDRYFKSVVFAASAAISAGAGALYAAYTSYIDPSTFTISQSILVLSMVVIGGAGRPWGPVLGAALLVVLPELLRAIGLPDDVASNIRQLLYGAALVAIAMLRPSGLVTASANRKQVG